MEHTDQAAAEQAGCGIFNLDGNLLDDQNIVIGEWTVQDPNESWMRENKKRSRREARKRPPPRPRLHWEDIPADVRKEITAELATGFNNMKQYLDLPERAVFALEEIATHLAFFREATNPKNFKEDVQHEKRGEGNPARIEGAGQSDPGNAVIEPDGKEQCAYPAGRYGFDEPHTANARAVCSIACPYNLPCKIKHRTFDDINQPRGSVTPPQNRNPDKA